MLKNLRILFLMLIIIPFCANAKLPQGFVYVRDIDSSIKESMRYYSDQNFTGKVVAGYKTPKAILTVEAATALKLVQQELLKEGYSLVIYDAYRPQKAVDNFISWSEDAKEQKMKILYYPRVEKGKVFDLGYVAKRSGHSRGSTVDLSIIKVSTQLKPIRKISLEKRKLEDSFEITFLNDGTLDMGSSFDLFDIASHHDSPVINDKYAARRNYLRDKMLKHGFKDYKNEWWHYTLENEPYPDTYFNFDVE